MFGPNVGGARSIAHIVPTHCSFHLNGRKIKSLVHPGRDAIFWVLERGPDSIKFVDGWKYVYTNVWTNIDKNTGKLTRDPQHTPVIGKKVEFAPSLWGGKDWPSAAYNEKTSLLYVPANENLTQSFKGEKVELQPGQLWLGTKVEDIKLGLRPGWDHIGELQAWDPATGKKAWQFNFPRTQLFGSVLTTAGGLVFVGGTNDRKLHALDAKTGKLLWEFVTNSGITAAPVAFEVDGTQYIAVQSGWGVDAQRIQDSLAALNVGFDPDVPQGGVVWVFAVK
jgi:alcohol dehydrogenase (cytochrome c)